MLPRYLSKTIIKKKKGLLTIFGILFGLGTFTIFGLTMSVGLIVHHKINAQNSVDIGAIYAAQKQAETLSVLSHLNYQLWQNYKLLSYRYNFLGNIGAYRSKGGASGQIDIIQQRVENPITCPNTGWRCAQNNQPTRCRENTVTNIEFNRLGCPPAFCVWHPYFHIPGKNTDTTNPCQNLHTTFPLAPENSGGIGIGYRLAQRTVGQLNAQIQNSCNSVGYVNWLVASASYLSFYDEQKKRKKFIEEEYFKKIIAKDLDLDGKSIKESVRKTIVKNLTLPIYRSEKFIYAKGSPKSENKNFRNYFEWIKVNPANLKLNYVQNINSTSTTACHRKVIDIFKVCDEVTPLNCKNNLDIPGNTCKAILNHPPSWNASRGISTRCEELREAKRDTEQVIGFKLRGDLLNKTNFYSQVFMYVNFHGGIFFPFRNTIPMIAQAFSKPFGASFGNPTDLGFLSVYPLANGDQYGLLAANRQYRLHKLMDTLTSLVTPPPPPPVNRVVSKVETAGFSLLNYMDLKVEGSAGMVLPLKPTSTPDSYGIDNDNILAFPARIMEEIAIAPDEYDERNFTFLTNYMLSAYIRLKDKKFKDKYVPPDIGHYSGIYFLEKIKNGTAINSSNSNHYQEIHNEYLEVLETVIAKTRRSSNSQYLNASSSSDLPFFLNYIERQINWAFFPVRDPQIVPSKLYNIDHTLTSYVSHMKGEFFTGKAEFRDINPQQRGPLDRVCSADPPVQCCFLRITDDLKMAGLKVIPEINSTGYLSWDKSNKRKHIPHLTHCVAGGRSGFSVKIIHPSTVSKDLLSSEKGRHNF